MSLFPLVSLFPQKANADLDSWPFSRPPSWRLLYTLQHFPKSLLVRRKGSTTGHPVPDAPMLPRSHLALCFSAFESLSLFSRERREPVWKVRLRERQNGGTWELGLAGGPPPVPMLRCSRARTWYFLFRFRVFSVVFKRTTRARPDWSPDAKAMTTKMRCTILVSSLQRRIGSDYESNISQLPILWRTGRRPSSRDHRVHPLWTELHHIEDAEATPPGAL